jgi:hypothetical protein
MAEPSGSIPNDSPNETTSALVTVATFLEPIEAEMAKGRIESAGITVFLSGENARMMEPGLGPLRLQVPSDEAEDARAILADAGEELAEANAGVVIHPNELP